METWICGEENPNLMKTKSDHLSDEYGKNTDPYSILFWDWREGTEIEQYSKTKQSHDNTETKKEWNEVKQDGDDEEES